MGYSRDSFHRLEEFHEQGGAEALMELRRKKRVPKNRVPEHGERAAIERTVETPGLGQKRTSWELRRKGVAMSSGVRSIRATILGQRKAAEGAREGETAQGGPWRGREPPPRLSGQPGHLRRGHDEGRGAHLTADFCHLCPRGGQQALHREDGDRRRPDLSNPQPRLAFRAGSLINRPEPGKEPI